MAGHGINESPMNDGFMKPPPDGREPGGRSPAEPIEKRNGSEGEDADLLHDADWVQMFKEALRASSDYMQYQLRSGWSRSYRAFANRHIEGSKYTTPRYRTRTQLFKPKTRMAVRKNDAAAAAALFSVSDVVSIRAELETDPLQVMTARFVAAALNYRLDRSTRKTGPNWFLTAVGARQDAQITGICVSKQYWEYEERTVDWEIERPRLGADGQPEMDEFGEQMLEKSIEKESRVITDRIMCDLIPAELCFADFAADWRDPVQSGGFWAVAFPVRLNDLETTVRKNSSRPSKGGGRWRSDINVRELTKGRLSTAQQTSQVRRSRDSGKDRYETRFNDKRGDTIWIYEVFYRYNGEDWTWWMLGETIMLSDPIPTREAYPEQDGDRPYTLGVGQLETHKTHPMSPVESWQPLQMELNEITNLTLDAQKMSVSPITKIRRGKNIDWKQVQGRGPDAMIMVDDAEDVTFEKAPGATGTEQIQINSLNVDFDELSGTFSQGSVQTNRQMNETVGGMNILSGAASNMTEFDLRVWGETWAEPAIRQLCRLIQYFESSETVIKVAGKRAGLLTIPGEAQPQPGPLEQPPMPGAENILLEQVLNNLDAAQISVRVNIGIGAQSPQQKLQNFGIASDMMLKMAGIIDADGIMPSGKAWMEDLMGIIGKKDADRYFTPKKDTGPPPEVQKMMMEMQIAQQKAELEAKAKQQEIEAKREENQMQMMKLLMEMRADQQKMAMEIDALREKNQLAREGQQIKQQGMIADQRIRQQGAIADQRQTIEHQADMHDMAIEHAEADHEMTARHGEAEFGALQRRSAAQHRQSMRQAADTHRQGMQQSKEMSKAKVEQTRAQAKAKPSQKPNGKKKGR